MPGIRLTLLAVVLVGLIILLVQNLSPALPLVFLGMRTRPLPLALWILLSITAGGLTSFLVSILFKLTNNLSVPAQSSSTSFKSTAKPPRVNRNTRAENIPSSSSSQASVGKNDDGEDDDFDDWDLDDNQADDWDFEETRQVTQPQTTPDKTTSKNSARSDSVYSYNSQTPKNTGVGKTESVYDADYRVIIPPYPSSTTNQSDDDQYSDDDWDFFEDDDLEDDHKNPSR
ncbi:LapA family protein [Okeanomitos corallinicola TIOX110]|uniref:LapA family protein n=1 Tax=Okeanomitos corallinicola TIOX110 TaxID=3133117 RepID=A0ABZ2URV9_9CYAN